MTDVVVFAAHPDDAEIACGGLLVRLARDGYRTVVVDLTRGELGTSGDAPTRRREADAAAVVLRLAERRNLELPDGGLLHTDRTQLAAVVAAIRDIRPGLVIAPYPRCSHPDHVETGRLVERAAHLAGIRKWEPKAGGPARPGAIAWFESRIPLEPSFLVDISDVAALKRKAIRCYRSQFERGSGSARTVINDPAFLANREARTRWLGTLIGVVEAEPYLVSGPLPVRDPIALFRSAPGPVGRLWGL